MCVQYQFLRLPTGSQILGLVRFDGTPYEISNTFFSLVPGGKEKYIFKMFIFENRLVNAPVSKVFCQKQIHFLKHYITCCYFSSFKSSHKLIPFIAIIRSSSVQKMAFQTHYFVTFLQTDISGRQKYLLFDEISVTRA